MATAETLTAKALLRMRLQHTRTELVRGVLVVREPAGFRHGAVAMRLALAIGGYARERSLGITVAAQTGFTLRRNPDTVRAADVAFVASDRCPDPDDGFAEMAPDLVVEVLSASDRPGDVLAKCADWLTAGCRLVWMVDTVRREACVHRADGSVSLIAAHLALAGEDVLPGFLCPLESALG